MLFFGLQGLGIETNHGVHDLPVILTGGLSDHFLFQPRKGTERIDIAVVQIKLALGNIAGIVRHRMGHIISGHGGHREDGDGTCPLKIAGFFIAHGQLGIQIPHVTPGCRDTFKGNADLLHGIGISGHIGHEHQHPFALLNGKFFRHRQGHIRNGETLHDRVGSQIHIHDRPVKHPMCFKSGLEKMVIVKNQAQAPEHQNIRIGLKTDARQQLIKRLPCHRKDGNLLAFHQAVEQVDHGNFRLNHFVRDHSHHGIYGGSRHLDSRIRQQLRAVVNRFSGPPENTPHNIVGVNHIGGMPQKPHHGIR